MCSKIHYIHYFKGLSNVRVLIRFWVSFVEFLFVSVSFWGVWVPFCVVLVGPRALIEALELTNAE